MDIKNEKSPVCPNCFGSEFRQVFATATSRNGLDDDPVPTVVSGRMSEAARKSVVKILCAHCGHELHRGGIRG